MGLQYDLIDVVKKYPGSTAREIITQLRERGYNAHKRDINPILYRERHTFRHDVGYVPRWSLLNDNRYDEIQIRAETIEQVRAKRILIEQVHENASEQYLWTVAKNVEITNQRAPLRIPTWHLNLWQWQKEAMQEWYKAGCCGIIEAVTGTGKTLLGLEAVSQVAQSGGRATVIVPTVILQEQWIRKIKEFLPGISIAAVGGTATGNCNTASVTVSVVNSATKTDFTEQYNAPTLLVADEAHRYGSEEWSAALRPKYGYRLGLTATYERESDEGIAGKLDPYFKEVVMSYDYERAIPENVVATFHLLFLGVNLTEEEQCEYENFNTKIGKSLNILRNAGGRIDRLQQDLPRLMSMGGPVSKAVISYGWATRSRRNLLANSQSKVAAISRLAALFASSRAGVVFTQTVKAAEDAAKSLRSQYVPAAALHSEMSYGERSNNILALQDESLRVLCAPKILDEGVDIPNLDLGVVLSASRSKRQMIQRLGRVIRRKDDGRSALFVVVFAIDTVEDPAKRAHEGFLDLVRKSAAKETILYSWNPETLASHIDPAEEEDDTTLVFEEDESFCVVCGREAEREWYGRMLCMKCLESEIEENGATASNDSTAEEDGTALVFEEDASSCDLCGQYADRERFGQMLCLKCLESEIEDDHTLPENLN